LSDPPNIKDIISDLRHDFSTEMLEEGLARKNPFEQFELWLSEAIQTDLREPNAMVLSTATPAGRPSSRVVLLRGFDEAGLIFYTNYDSRKADELSANPQAAILFYWADIAKQVRIEGTVERVAEEISDTYFSSRPRGNQIGALASPQSKVIANRTELEEKFASLENSLTGREIERPANWGGYILKPETFEFWQGRESRLHDRLLYTKNGNQWTIERLAP
jgi:pyridoxamine 5'-phosphate oxidase